MGGGGDGGYAERQAQQDRTKQAARNALNVNFGIGPSGSALNQSDFMKQEWVPGVGGSFDAEAGGGAASGGGGSFQSVFDQAAYDAALAAEAAQGGQAETNKAALDALYAGVRENAFTAGKRRADEQKTTAGRDLGFELFARGLNGGSVDIDQNALLGRKYSEGLTDLGAKADATATSLRANDEGTRVSLLQSIDNGMDQGSAISSALNQLKNNSDKAASEATGMTLGDLFANSGLLYEQGRRARGEQSAIDAWRYQSAGGYGSKAPKGSATGTSSWAG